MITTLIASALLGVASTPALDSTAQLPPLGLILEPTNSQGEFHLKFINESDQAIHLNLGSSLANGQTLRPTSVKLIAEVNGSKVDWLYAPSGFGRISGRMDDYLVSLAPKASYELVLNLNIYTTKGPGGRRPQPGTYKVRAHFVGTGLVYDNPDLAGNKLLTFWEGGAYSPEVEFDYRP
ncbi:MAG: hypothetical protein KF824_04340 [Fimbriimonadaceae bacterium]|nr:MAG: hypothetical protein KF824_04340 [Fimbriimonadaceae bacterium]